ncbi:MAG: DUF5661 family protein [bacterium]
MKLPEYVTKDEVKRVCKELGIRNWAALKKVVPSAEEAKKIKAAIGAKDIKISAADFRDGLEVELEHGTRFPEANVTNNHPVLTGKIVIAHLKETLDYYKRLDVAEIEGDVHKALVAKDAAKLEKYLNKLAKAKLALSKAETAQLK